MNPRHKRVRSVVLLSKKAQVSDDLPQLPGFLAAGPGSSSFPVLFQGTWPSVMQIYVPCASPLEWEAHIILPPATTMTFSKPPTRYSQ